MPLDHDLLNEVLQKTAFAPPGPPGGMPVTDPAAAAMAGGGAPPPGMPPGAPPGAPPMDPSMMGGAPPMPGAPPMDPSMMGGAPPMDPSMMGAPPMDPSMMGGAPPMDPAMAMEAAGVPPDGAMDPMADLLEQIRTIVREEMGKGGDEAKGEGEGGDDVPSEPDTDDRLNALEDMMGQLLSAAGISPSDEASAGMPPATPEEALPEQMGQMPEAPPMDSLGAPPSAAPEAAGGLLEGQSLMGPTDMMSPAMKEAADHNDRLHKLIRQLNTYT